MGYNDIVNDYDFEYDNFDTDNDFECVTDVVSDVSNLEYDDDGDDDEEEEDLEYNTENDDDRKYIAGDGDDLDLDGNDQSQLYYRYIHNNKDPNLH